MKEIKIKQLMLDNFKCHKHLQLEFDGQDISIYGNNGTGKTSVYDAITWLLFGKTSDGSSDMDRIKPIDNTGSVCDHFAETVVEAILLVDGAEMTLRRTCAEVWTTKRGSCEATYDGNTSAYFVDGVPCKKNAYQQQIRGLVDEDTWLLLTSVSYFASKMPWQKRRAVLFDAMGMMDDTAIMQSAPDHRFHPLLEGMGKLSLEDYRQKLLAEKRGYVGARTEIPARISECEKTIAELADLDFAEARANLNGTQLELDDLSARILAIQHSTASEQIKVDLRSTQLELDELERENRAYRIRQIPDDIGVLQSNLASLRAQIAHKQRMIEREQSYIDDLTKRMETSRRLWSDVNAEKFGGGICPVCKQELPAEQIEKAEKQFYIDKQMRLNEIVQTGNSHKNSKVIAEDRIKVLRDELDALKISDQEAQKQIAIAERDAASVRNLDGYVERCVALRQQMADMEQRLQALAEDDAAVLADLQRRKQEVAEEAAVWSAVAQKESILDYARSRVETLRAEARDATACLESVEQLLFLIEDFTRYKAGFVEERVNGLFRLARFRLFRPLANGGLEDRCDAVHDGVPYDGLNHAMQINVGIDIINTLSSVYGVSVPLFIDNAESVTQLETCYGQQIRLIVADLPHKNLEVKYEN